MGEFPSGQRGQTVNLLRIASMVRIRPPPPQKNHYPMDSGFLWYGCWEGGFERAVQADMPVACLPTRGFSAEKRIRPPPPNKHRNLGIKITVLIFDSLPKTMDFQYFCVKFRAAAVLSRSGRSCL